MADSERYTWPSYSKPRSSTLTATWRPLNSRVSTVPGLSARLFCVALGRSLGAVAARLRRPAPGNHFEGGSDSSSRLWAPTLGRVPRISRLLALAFYMDDLCRRGEVADYADLARLAMVTRARMTQIMSLLLLAPDIQEEILYLPRSAGGRDPIREKAVRPIAAVPDWRKQRDMWKNLKAVIHL
jgi:hypothetical protein